MSVHTMTETKSLYIKSIWTINYVSKGCLCDIAVSKSNVLMFTLDVCLSLCQVLRSV